MGDIHRHFHKNIKRLFYIHECSIYLEENQATRETDMMFYSKGGASHEVSSFRFWNLIPK